MLLLENFEYESGVGVSGVVEGKKIQAGGFLLLEKLEMQPPVDEDEGIETKIFIIIEGELAGFITFADQIRESSYEAIQTLQKNGIKCLLLTGDNEKVAAAVAKALKMDGYMAEVL